MALKWAAALVVSLRPANPLAAVAAAQLIRVSRRPPSS